MISFRIVHIITGLGLGGAERMLVKLVTEHIRHGHSVLIVSLKGEEALAEILRKTGAEVLCLGFPSKIFRFPKALKRLREFRPDLIQGWMYHGNLFALFLRKAFFRGIPLIWGIRKSLSSFDHERLLTRAVIRAGAYFSKTVDSILYNSSLGRNLHRALGYRGQKDEVIPNGFVIPEFPTDPEPRRRLLRELRLPEDSILIGHIGRYHSVKNHRGLIRAFGKISYDFPAAILICSGPEVQGSNGSLRILIEELGLQSKVFLMGPQNAERILAALDLFCLPSFDEGFANVLGEAMSFGVPCVASPAGVNAEIIQDLGWISKGFEVEDIEEALRRALTTLPIAQEQKRRLHATISERFSIESVARRYVEIYDDLIRARSLPK